MRTSLALVIALLAFLGIWMAMDRALRPVDPRSQKQVIDAGSGGGAALDDRAGELQRPHEATANEGRQSIATVDAEAPELVVGGRVLVVPEKGTAAEAQPYEGASVKVGVSEPMLESTTGPDGRFRLTMFDRGDRPMSTLLTVTGREELLRWSKRIDFTEGMSGPDDLIVYLVHAPVATGLVVTPDGRPVTGASIGHKKAEARTNSDANGEFALAGLPHDDLRSPLQLEDRLLASKPGWEVISIDVPGFDPNMVWMPVRIVMTESSSLTVKAEARDGTALAGLHFSLDLSPDGPFSRNEAAVFGFNFDARFAETDSSGIASLTSVPANVQLRLQLRNRLEFEAIDRSGVLVGNGDAHAGVLRPLTVQPGGATRVTYMPDAQVTLRGRVLEADGSPSANARLRFEAIEAEARTTSIEPDRARTKDDGTFELSLAITGEAQHVLVRAQSTVGERGSYSPFGGTVFPDPLCFAQETVNVAAPHELTLRLSPQGRMTGRVLSPGGEPVQGHVIVRLRPDGEAAPFDFTLGAHLPSSHSISRGSFEFKDVPPGTYCLEARSSDHGVQMVAGIAHDASDVVLQFEDPRATRLMVRVKSSAGVSNITVDSADIQVSRLLGEPGTLLPGATISDPLGFDGGGLSMSSGSASVHTAGVRGIASVTYHPGSEATLSLAPGLHWIGVRGTDLEGRQLFPAGTGPVRIGPGEHEIQFELHGTASLEGHASPAAAGGAERLLELHLPDGTLVPCIGARLGMTSSFRISADGQFRVKVLPACPLEVWVGTRAQLKARRPESVTLIHPRVGENLEVEIDG